MDVDARRLLWDSLRRLKSSRTILLCTHYMDEAGVLGDRVGIMARGSMQTVGSPQVLVSPFAIN